MSKKKKDEAAAEEVTQVAEEAAEETQRMIAHARTRIQVEQETAMRDIRRQVAMISVEVAEKIVRKDLEGDDAQQGLIDRMVDEAAQAQIPN